MVYGSSTSAFCPKSQSQIYWVVCLSSNSPDQSLMQSGCSIFPFDWLINLVYMVTNALTLAFCLLLYIHLLLALVQDVHQSVRRCFAPMHPLILGHVQPTKYHPRQCHLLLYQVDVAPMIVQVLNYHPHPLTCLHPAFPTLLYHLCCHHQSPSLRWPNPCTFFCTPIPPLPSNSPSFTSNPKHTDRAYLQAQPRQGATLVGDLDLSSFLYVNTRFCPTHSHSS